MAKQIFRILLADHPAEQRHHHKALLESIGHSVFTAENGKQALDMAATVQPDLILMNLSLPTVSGEEAGLCLRRHPSTSLIPIIYLNANNDEILLARCAASGAADFLVTPVSLLMLSAKITVHMNFIRSCSQKSQRLLVLENSLLLYKLEYESAEQILLQHFSPNLRTLDNVNILRSPKHLTSGDFLLQAQRACGTQLILIGDSSGHGLSAAVGNLPMVSAFYSMAKKDISASLMLHEFNLKIKETSPPGFFVAAAFIELNPAECSIRVWNGGMPDLLLYCGESHKIIHLPSNNMPLGIKDPDKFRSDLIQYAFSRNSRIFLYSDGVVDHRLNDMGITEDQLEHLIVKYASEHDLVNIIKREIYRIKSGQTQFDDLIFVEVRHPDSNLGNTTDGPLQIAN